MNFDKYEPLRAKFETRVHKGESWECWPWKGMIDRSGYGWMRDRRRLTGKTALMAHHLAMRFWRPEANLNGFYVRSRCGRRDCCNPLHLYLADQVAYSHGEKPERKIIVKVTDAQKLTGDDAVMARDLRWQGVDWEDIAYLLECTVGEAQMTVLGIEYEIEQPTTEGDENAT